MAWPSRCLKDDCFIPMSQSNLKINTQLAVYFSSFTSVDIVAGLSICHSLVLRPIWLSALNLLPSSRSPG